MALQDSWDYHQKYKSLFVEIKNQDDFKSEFVEFVEFDYGSCNTSNNNLILRPDGKMYLDWDSNISISEDKFIISYLKKISTTSTCLGRNVSAIIIKDDRILGVGSNCNSDCLEKKVCNRVLNNSNEDYTNCLCTHAEFNAVRDAILNGNNLDSSKLYAFGHHFMCKECQELLKSKNISWEIIK